VSFPYAPVALAVAFVLAPYGMIRFLSEKNSKKKDTKKEETDGRDKTDP
jgi:hypothetical protein